MYKSLGLLHQHRLSVVTQRKPWVLESPVIGSLILEFTIFGCPVLWALSLETQCSATHQFRYIIYHSYSCTKVK